MFWIFLQGRRRTKTSGTEAEGEKYLRLPEKEADLMLAGLLEITFFCVSLQRSYVIQTNSLVSDMALTAVQVS